MFDNLVNMMTARAMVFVWQYKQQNSHAFGNGCMLEFPCSLLVVVNRSLYFVWHDLYSEPSRVEEREKGSLPCEHLGMSFETMTYPEKDENGTGNIGPKYPRGEAAWRRGGAAKRDLQR